MQHVGPYTLLQRIGAGGMAEIFLARRESPGGVAKVVALKRILPHLAMEPDFVAMFLDEAQLAARLSHPHIAQIYDFGQAEGHYFIAMEYVPGEDLLTIIRRARELGRLTPPHVGALILAAACAALHHAHEQRDEHGHPLGIVHRDVTPSNLLVSHDGVVKLVDFGIAKAERRLTVTEAGALKGKYAYMSPEYALGQPVDRRSDVFSLGIVGFELLTHRRLFHRESELAVLRAITEEAIPSARSRRDDLPRALDGILARALARDPEARFQSAEDLQLALEDFAAATGAEVGVSAIQNYMHELFGDNEAQRRRRWAVGDLDDGSEATEGLGRAPSAMPDERTWAAGSTPRRGAAPTREPAAAGAPPAASVDASGGRAAAGARPPGAKPTEGPGARAAGRAGAAVAALAPGAPFDDGHAVPDLRHRPWLTRALVALVALGLIAGGAALALRSSPPPAPSTTVPAPELPRVGPDTPGALDAPRFDTQRPRPVAQPVQRPEPSPTDATSAWLTVEAPAGARIIVDGVEIGVAPLLRRKLAAGMHTVTVVGTEPRFEESFALDLVAGAEHRETVSVDRDGRVTHVPGTTPVPPRSPAPPPEPRRTP
jgi:serine/threonine-protein kinase